MTRILIFTGKGGVGKTSIAAAHARKAAKSGRKTLIVSTDMAHNLGDLLEQSIGKEEKKVTDNLYALEIDPNYEMEHHYGTIMEAIKNMFPSKDGTNKSEEAFEDIMMFPGIEELFSLLKIQEIAQEKIYEMIIVDCAPTGETLSLLKFPELLSWYMEKFFPIEKVAVKVLRPISKQIFQLELPSNHAMNDIERLYIRLHDLQILLKNREQCSIRLVTIPEKMIVEETKRSYMYLNLYNFNVDGVYINRVLPKEVENDFFQEWLKIQHHYITELEAIFYAIPLYKIKWYDTDLNGLEALDRVIEDSLFDKELFKVKQITQNELYEKIDTRYRLKIYLPCAKKEDLIVQESGTDIILRIGNTKRNIPIPNTIRNYIVQSAKVEKDNLMIYFTKEKAE